MLYRQITKAGSIFKDVILKIKFNDIVLERDSMTIQNIMNLKPIDEDQYFKDQTVKNAAYNNIQKHVDPFWDNFWEYGANKRFMRSKEERIDGKRFPNRKLNLLNQIQFI